MIDKKNKIGICTDTGWNYGSALQSYATRYILNQIGYEGVVIKLSGSLVKGRDVRIKKAIIMGMRILFHLPTYLKKAKRSTDTEEKSMSLKTEEEFENFYNDKVQLKQISERKLKQLARTEEYKAFLCGSDQIWITTSFYVDPFYYLDFAPEKKRIAFAPSFGREFIPEFNKKRIGKYINNIPYLSVREQSGVKLIREITNKPVEVLLDPTLIVSKNEWINLLQLKENVEKKSYVLAYFLSKPSNEAINVMNKLSERGLDIITLPYQRKGDWFDYIENGGPKEFLQLLLNADTVCTDSFHGTAFSINFNKDFYVFEREYGKADNQNTRLISLLNIMNLIERLGCDEISRHKCDFSFSNDVLENERIKAKTYLIKALEGK